MFNGDGIDLVAFGDSNIGTLVLDDFAPTTTRLQRAFLGGFNVVEGGRQFGGGIYGWDLSDFGFAPGEAYVDGLRIAPSGIFSSAYDIAAFNSRAVSNPQAVPLPAGLPLLVAGLDAIAGLRRKSV